MTKIRPEPTSDPASTVKTLNFKTESRTGSITDEKYRWKPLVYSEIEPRAGFFGWLGRKLDIKRWGWIERNVMRIALQKPKFPHCIRCGSIAREEVMGFSCKNCNSLLFGDAVEWKEIDSLNIA